LRADEQQERHADGDKQDGELEAEHFERGHRFSSLNFTHRGHGQLNGVANAPSQPWVLVSETLKT